MRTILAISAILALPALAFAQERVPSWQDSQLVPDPIPANICVEVHWTEKSRSWKEGMALNVYYPPLPPQLRADMKQIRDEGKATLVRCSATDT